MCIKYVEILIGFEKNNHEDCCFTFQLKGIVFLIQQSMDVGTYYFLNMKD